MRNIIFKSIVFTATISAITFSARATDNIKRQVIYGEDNRVEYYQASQMIKNVANSTVALVATESLLPTKTGYKYKAEKFLESYNVCPTERFAHQPTLADASGFLVAPNLIMTAGHNIRSESDCEQMSFVFGYAMKRKGFIAKTFKKNDVYACKKIISSAQEGAGVDFALIQLDRPVVGRTPLALRKTGKIKIGEPVAVVGNPVGLPLKVAGGLVRSINTEFFVTNVDSYSGNSGSAVINLKDGLVEGILVRGEYDFEPEKGCLVSKRCAADACQGEDVTSIASVIHALNKNNILSGVLNK